MGASFGRSSRRKSEASPSSDCRSFFKRVSGAMTVRGSPLARVTAPVEAGSGGSAARIAATVRSRIAESEVSEESTPELDSMADSALAAASARGLAPRLAEAPLREWAKRCAAGASLAARALRISETVADWESAKRWRRDS